MESLRNIVKRIMSRKALIFDMGGVLVDLDIEGCKAAFKSILGYERIDELIIRAIRRVLSENWRKVPFLPMISAG